MRWEVISLMFPFCKQTVFPEWPNVEVLRLHFLGQQLCGHIWFWFTRVYWRNPAAIYSQLCGKENLIFHDTSILSFICTSPAGSTWHSMLSGMALFPGQSAVGLGSCRSPKYTLRLLGLQSPLNALDAFQTCSLSQATVSSMCQSRGKGHSRSVAFMDKWAPDSFSALLCFTVFYARHQVWWLQCISLSWLYHVSLLSWLPAFPVFVLANTGKCQSVPCEYICASITSMSPKHH